TVARLVVASWRPLRVRGCLPVDVHAQQPQEQPPIVGVWHGNTAQPCDTYSSAAGSNVVTSTTCVACEVERDALTGRALPRAGPGCGGHNRQPVPPWRQRAPCHRWTSGRRMEACTLPCPSLRQHCTR